MNDIKQWFLDQTPRDQLVLSIGGVLALIFILLFVILFPMQDDLAKQERRNRSMLNEQNEVLGMAGQLLARRDPAAGSGAGPTLNALVNSTTRDFGIRMESLQPSGNTAEVRIGVSDFNSVMAWLHEMEIKRGLQVKDLTITASTVPGSVVVRLQLVQGG